MKAFPNLRAPVGALASTLVLSLGCAILPAHAQGKAIDNEAVEEEMAAKFRPDTAKEARDKRNHDRPDDPQTSKTKKPTGR
ncbi:MAG: hypothetical protein R3E68_04475 [Burkholderiaceae bacterium]